MLAVSCITIPRSTRCTYAAVVVLYHWPWPGVTMVIRTPGALRYGWIGWTLWRGPLLWQVLSVVFSQTGPGGYGVLNRGRGPVVDHRCGAVLRAVACSPPAWRLAYGPCKALFGAGFYISALVQLAGGPPWHFGSGRFAQSHDGPSVTR